MLVLTRIAVATDFGEAADNALAYGRELAQRFDATLVILHVVDDVAARMMTAAGIYDERATEEAVAAARRRLDALASPEEGRRLRVEAAHVVSTDPAVAIIDFAGRSGIDLLILGTHGRGAVSHLFMGSVAEHVVRTAPCPVLTVHAKEHEFIRPNALEAVGQP